MKAQACRHSYTSLKSVIFTEASSILWISKVTEFAVAGSWGPNETDFCFLLANGIETSLEKDGFLFKPDVDPPTGSLATDGVGTDAWPPSGTPIDIPG